MATIIHPVSFHKTKAKHIISTCIALCESWGGDIPRTPEGLLSLKGDFTTPILSCQGLEPYVYYSLSITTTSTGVGPKVMILVTDLAWGECVGICVDTHVHRIAGRLGWVEVTKQPEMTRMQVILLVQHKQPMMGSWSIMYHFDNCYCYLSLALSLYSLRHGYH